MKNLKLILLTSTFSALSSQALVPSKWEAVNPVGAGRLDCSSYTYSINNEESRDKMRAEISGTAKLSIVNWIDGYMTMYLYSERKVFESAEEFRIFHKRIEQVCELNPEYKIFEAVNKIIKETMKK